MAEASRCWLCHRDVGELTQAIPAETQEEKRIKNQMSQVALHKSKFTESSELWRRGVPRDFKDMDFQFILGNAGQFGSIKALGEAVDAKKLMIDWLVDVSATLHGEARQALPDIASLERGEREALVGTLEQFEMKWRRALGKGGKDGRGYPMGFEGLKLADGLEFLIAEGLLYYDVRAQLFQMALAKAAGRRPQMSVSNVRLNGYPPVPLCSICASLIKEIRAPNRAVAEEVARQKVEPASEAAPLAQTVEIAEAASVTGDVPEGASPQLVEIIRKIGPAAKEAPKSRSLHEHRIKEDSEDLVEQKAAEG